MSLICEVGEIKLTKNLEIDEEILKKLYSSLCNSKERMDEKDLNSFLEKLQSSFNMLVKNGVTKYENEKEALESYRAISTYTEYNIIEHIGKKYGSEKISFYSFKNAFLDYLSQSDPNKNLKIDSSLSFHQLTMREDSIFVKEEIKENKSNSFGSSPSKKIELAEDPNFNLPNQKGLRFTIFSIIFSYFSPSELMKLGLVSKEWLSISRHDFLWKTFFQQHYQSNLEEKYPYKPRNMDRKPPARMSLNERIYSELKKYQVSENTPWFLEYWIVKDHILQITSNYNHKPQAPRRCGINVDFRGNQQISSLDEPAILSSSNQFMIPPEEISQDVGCCHDSVSIIANKCFEAPTFGSLCSLKMNQKESQEWKRKITQQVSLECMKDAMEEREIRTRILILIQNKFFDL
jgi:hypothetical protein